MEPFKIFIGFDDREALSWFTCANSILRRSSIPVTISPLRLENLRGFFSREVGEGESNSFSYSRFLVPFLCDFKGDALYMDCDMVMLTDIASLLTTVNREAAVNLVKHNYESKVSVKYLGNKQENYPRKNWSSFIYFNNAHEKNKILTPEFVDREPGKILHRFAWLEDEEIGELDKSWNFLVGEYERNSVDPSPKVLHWTLGGPYFNDYHDSDFADVWEREMREVIYVENSGPRCPRAD